MTDFTMEAVSNMLTLFLSRSAQDRLMMSVITAQDPLTQQEHEDLQFLLELMDKALEVYDFSDEELSRLADINTSVMNS